MAEGSTVQPFGGGAYIPDPLAQFLSRVVPWGHGFVGLHAWTPKHDSRTQFRRGGGGEAFVDMAEYGQMQQFVALINRSGDEAFVCMSSRDGFKEEVTRASGRRVRKASRKAGAVALKSLWVDLDVKSTGYPSQEAALAALRAFCADLGLVPGFIVNSGGGVHCYFVLDRPVPVDVWAPLAGRLAAAAKDKGLKIDKVTTDATRVMRLPTSLNQKLQGNPRPVEIIEQGPDMTLAQVEAILAPYTPIVTPGVRSPPTAVRVLDPAIFPRRPPITNGPDVARVSAELEKNRVVTSIDLLRQACPVVADSEARGGDGDIEPLWFELAKLCHYIDRGRDYFHDLSSDDPRYDEQATDQKFDLAQGLGWPQCATIAMASPAAAAICQRCAFHGKGKSPINHAVYGLLGTTGAALPMQQTVQPSFVPYVNGANGHSSAAAFISTSGNPIFLANLNAVNHTLDVDGYIVTAENERVFKTKVSNIEGHWETTKGGHEVIRLHVTIPKGTQANDEKVVSFTAGEIGSPTGTKSVRDQGLTFAPSNLAKVVTLMDDWTTIVRQQQAMYAETRLGWVYGPDNEISGFAYAGSIFDTTGRHTTSIASLRDVLTPRGNLNDWRKAANFFVGKGCIEMEVMMATAFAAPLVVFTSVAGVIVAARADTGYGKTASLHTSASVWGSRSQVPLSATMNYIDAEIVRKNNLPVYFDEIVTGPKAQTGRFSEMVLRITGGIERGRQDRNSQSMEVRSSRTMLVAASNHSLTDAASTRDTSAQAARVFEIEMSAAIKRLGISQAQAGENRDMLEANYGQAGLVYAEVLGMHHDAIKAMVRDEMNYFQKTAGIIDGDAARYWISCAASLIVGATLSKKLNLMDFDILSMRKFLVEQLQRQHGRVKDMAIDANDPEVQLARVRNFMNSNPNWVVTDILAKQGGAPNHCVLKGGSVYANMRGFVLRYAVDDHKVLISEAAIKGWCQKEEISYRELLKTLEKNNYCTRPRKPRSLTAGTHLHSATEMVLVFDLTLPCNATLVTEDHGA